MMVEKNLRDANKIAEEMRIVRTGKVSIDNWSLEEISEDLESLNLAIITDINKLKKCNFKNKSAKQRIRLYTLAIETLGNRFRVLSVKH
jgi:hypothetical protein